MMQNLTIKIPDNKVAFFLELIHNLGFVKIDKQENVPVLSQEQIQLVEEERIKIRQNPDYLLNWEQARKSLKLD